MRIFRALPNLGVTACQQQRTRITNLGPNQPEVARRIEQTRIPAFPVWQQQFDLIAKTHARNVTEQQAPDNAFRQLRLFLEHAGAEQRGTKQHRPENNDLYLRNPACRNIERPLRNDSQYFGYRDHELRGRFHSNSTADQYCNGQRQALYP